MDSSVLIKYLQAIQTLGVSIPQINQANGVQKQVTSSLIDLTAEAVSDKNPEPHAIQIGAVEDKNQKETMEKATASETIRVDDSRETTFNAINATHGDNNYRVLNIMRYKITMAS